MIRSLARGLKLVIDDSMAKHARSYSTPTTKRLEGKVALVTAGASGLGKATALEFVQHGAQVLIADVNTTLGQDVVKELGAAAQFVQCDVAVEAEVKEAVDTAVGHHGKLDIMYNNAGIPGPIQPSIVDLDLDEFDKLMQINVRGMIAGIKHAARVMIPMGSGSILCTSSICGILGGLGPHAYTISKFTIPGIVKAVASELCKHGIRINCISPGPIPTPQSMGQIAQFYPDVAQHKIAEMINRMGGELEGTNCEDIDVAKAALYLASDEAKYISGHNLVVDGGFTSFKSLNLTSPV